MNGDLLFSTTYPPNLMVGNTQVLKVMHRDIQVWPRVTGLVKYLNDTISFLDGVTTSIFGNISKTLSDSIIFNDNIDSISYGLTKSLDDTISFIDNIATSLGNILSKGLSDEIIFSDDFAKSESYERNLADTISFLDGMQTNLPTNWTKNLSDIIYLSDAILKSNDKTKVLSDTIILSDGVVIVGNLLKTINDTITFSDTKSAYDVGFLYNYRALTNLAPTGWHIPTDAEWHTLALYLDSTATLVRGNESLIAGGKLKEVGTTHWLPPNTGATNLYGFSARGGGHRNYDGAFQEMQSTTTFATSTINGTTTYWYRSLGSSHTILYRNYDYLNSGFSVRLIKDNSINPGTMSDIDGNIYSTVKIGSQVWTASNLKTTRYNTGDPIPLLIDDSSWSATSIGARSIYPLI